MTLPAETDFDDWIIATHAEAGDFTMLFVLLGVGETTVEPRRAAWLHVMGDETRWPEMKRLFIGAGVAWDGVVFYRAGREGLVPDNTARARLAALTARLHEDRSLIRDGFFFNADGLTMQLEEVRRH